MEENKSKSVIITLVATLAGAACLVCFGGTLGLGYYYTTTMDTESEEISATQPELTPDFGDSLDGMATPSQQRRPTFTPLPTATATSTPTPEPEAEEEAVPEDAPIESDEVYMRFHVQVERLWLYTGPGEDYSPIAIATQGDVLLAAGRTANGLWWLVCCVDEHTGWIKLDGNNVLADGDPNGVRILEGTEEFPEESMPDSSEDGAFDPERYRNDGLASVGLDIGAGRRTVAGSARHGPP